MFEEENPLLPVSWVADYAFCQWAGYAFFTGLENFEQKNTVYQDSIAGHLSVHEQQSRYREKGIVQKTDVSLSHDMLYLTGKADMVELWPEGKIVPIEYKRSVPAEGPHFHHQVQLCLQALCLEKQYQKDIPEGVIYSITSHQRVPVPLTPLLREQTLNLLSELKNKLKSGNPNMFQKRNDLLCRQCTFFEICLPPVFFDELRKTSSDFADQEEF